MSNAMNPLSVLTLGMLSTLLTACSLLGWGTPNEVRRPYLEAAREVVARIEEHTPLSSSCRSAATTAVESGITLRLATTEDEFNTAATVYATMALRWESSNCPTAAVPGLSFGAANMSDRIRSGAHKSAGLR
jgi:hypothetical protein